MSDKLTRPGSLGAGQMGIDRRTTQDLVNLKREIEEVAGRRTIVTPARQAVLSGRTFQFSNGGQRYPMYRELFPTPFIHTNNGASPLILSIADGFNEYGAVDHILAIKEDTPLEPRGWVDSPPYSPIYRFLILEDDGTWRIESSPFYTTNEQLGGQISSSNPLSLQYFEPVIDGAYTLSKGVTTSYSGMGTKLDNTSTLVCNYNSISFGGTDHCTFRSFQMGKTFTIYVNVNPTNLSAARVILANASAAYSFRLNIAATTGKLLLYASSNGSSFNLANGVSSTNGIPAGQYSDIKIVYDLQYIKVYINDNLEINKAATAPIHTAVGASAYTTRGLRFGADSAGTAATMFVGEMTGIFLMNNIVWDGVRPIPEIVPNQSEHISQSITDDLKMYWFDTMTMRMYRYMPKVVAGSQYQFWQDMGSSTPVKGIMIEKYNLVMFGTTYTAIIRPISNNTSYSFNDNLGTVLKDMTIYTRQSPAYSWTQANKQFRSYHYGYQPVIVDDMNVKAYQPASSAYTGTGVDQGEDAFGTGNNTAAEMFVVVRRLF